MYLDRLQLLLIATDQLYTKYTSGFILCLAQRVYFSNYKINFEHIALYIKMAVSLSMSVLDRLPLHNINMA